MKRGHTAAFTLIEMSVVLVIIGIIIGGIMFGRSVLVTSRLQTVITDADNYTSAMANFKQTFQALPGDMATATASWGYPSGANSGDTPSYSTSCASLQGTGTQTCNGDGNGQIGNSGREYESFRFWQQLHLAGMLNQSLTGVAGTSGVQAATVGVNVPKGSLEGSGFSAVWLGTVASGNANFIAGSYGNVLIFGGAGSGMLTTSAILTPDQAAGIDAKIDDGAPGTGKVRSLLYNATYAPACTTNATPTAYNVTSTSVACPLIFTTGY
jgi:prepilin-type N-terminal cleavage/methylation domain-containing protein